MKKYLFYTLLSFLTLLLITIGIGMVTTMHWTEASFFVGAGGMLISFFFSSSGDGFSRASTAAVIESTNGSYVQENEKPKLSLNPFLIGAVAYFLISFLFPYI
ncbi:hypothetical protein J2S74_002219 [Evansella vedderi]|uniref:Uncharacterized protein n=1 Tax=Evansella vedderi TaxID=38282 RepID=A0ABT9ZV73_9BACI|nr:hypothetical protein [Evansella vedderi]MDQ0254840.1 hypothetical protein [Evansella vedderi]